MTSLNLLYDLGVILIAAGVLGYIARLVKQPALTFYILSGFIIGPFGLSLITSLEEINTLAEIGIAFLLFAAGLDIDITKLGTHGKYTLLAGTLQVILTLAFGLVISTLLGISFIGSLYVGLALATSSTAAVTKILTDRRLIDSLRGKTAIGILIVQDIAFVIALPLLGSFGGVDSTSAITSVLIRGSFFVGISIIAGWFIIPKILKSAAKEEENFVLTSMALCFLFIGAANYLNLSIVLGALMGGLVLSNPYTHGIIASTRNVRDFFTVIFFSSLGMQLNFSGIGQMIPAFIVFFLVIVIMKPLLTIGILGSMGFGTRAPIMVAAILSQISELSFILAQQGLSQGHLSSGIFSVIMGLTILTTILTPYTYKVGEMLSAEFTRRYPAGILSDKRIKQMTSSKEDLQNHVILIGCHKTGREVLEKIKHVPHIIIDHDPRIVESLHGYNCIYGVPDDQYTLEVLGVGKAKAIVITAPDIEMSSFVVKESKLQNPDIKIIARARTIEQALKLYTLETDVVIVPDILTGREMGQIVKDALEGKVITEGRDEHIEAFKQAYDENFLL